MRTYGRTIDNQGNKTWVVVETDVNGFNDRVWLTTVIQTLKLNLGESPFFANAGIPAHVSVMQQIAPDFYAVFTQQTYAKYFASLIISREHAAATPTYNVAITTNQGFTLSSSVPVAT